MNLKTILLVLTGFVSSIVPMHTNAQGAYGRRGNFGVREIPGLTLEQKEKVEAIRIQNTREVLTNKNSILEKTAALKSLTQQDTPSIEQVNQLLDEIYALKLVMAKSRMQSHLTIRNELSDKQKLFFDIRAKTNFNNFGPNRAGYINHRLQNRHFFRNCPDCLRHNSDFGPGRRGIRRSGWNQN